MDLEQPLRRDSNIYRSRMSLLTPQNDGDEFDKESFERLRGYPTSAETSASARRWPTDRLQVEAYSEQKRAERIWYFYLYGQSSNVAKAAVWWSMFGTLVISLTSRDEAVGISRAAFNVALVLVSPFAGAFSEYCRISTLLKLTTLFRMIIWVVLVPASWVILNNYSNAPLAFWRVLIALMFLDGIQVAFANVVDIDCGGLETLCQQFNLPVNDDLRNKINSIHQMVFDLSFLLLTIPIAVALLELTKFIDLTAVTKLFGADQGIFSLLLGICVVHLILSLISLICYQVGLSKKTFEGMTGFGANSFDGGEVIVETDSAHGVPLRVEFCNRLRDILDGFYLVKNEKALRWRLLFLAFETAFEDSVVSVVIPEVALRSSEFLTGTTELHVTAANLWAVCIIAAGKVGGLVAGVYMSSRWVPPLSLQRDSSYSVLFWFVLFSSLSICLFPIGRYLYESWHAPYYVVAALYVLASFFFFVFSTAPKTGFATLLQNLVLNNVAAARIFGFVGTFVTITDALVILGINYVFIYFRDSSKVLALGIVSAIYVIHGLIEAIIGPLVVLESSDQNPEQQNSMRLDVFQE